MASFKDILQPSTKELNLICDDLECNTINGNIPPSVGTFNNGDIPIRNPLGGTPFFTDSGVNVSTLSFPPVEAKVLDINTSYPSTNTIVSIRDTINNENQMFVGISGLGEDGDLIIGNQSLNQKFIAIGNTNGEVSISGVEVNINDQNNNTINISQSNGIDILNDIGNSITLNNNQITLFNDNGNNSINLNNAFGLFINSNSQNVLQSVTNSLTVDPTNIQLNSSDTMFLNSQNSLTLQDPIGDSVSIFPNQVNVVSNTGDVNINSGLRITLNEFTDGHFFKMDNSEVILAANSAKPLTIATDNELRLKASSSYGLNDQVLTSNGLGYCEWKTISLSNSVMNQTLYRLTNFLAGASGTGVIRIFNESGQATISSAVQSSINTACYLRIDPSDYPETIGSKVRRLQLVYNVVTGSVLPASNFTVQLYTYTSSGIATGLTITVGSTFGNSASIIAPVINSTTTASSTPFTFPLSATNYVLGITNSASTASFTHHSVYLKVVYV